METFCNGCNVLYDNYPLFDLQIYILVALLLFPLFIGTINLLRGLFN